MNCSLIREEIDRMVFEPGQQPGKEISGHLDSCAQCREYFREGPRVAGIVGAIRNLQPTLTDPEQLTAQIMHAISKDEGSLPGSSLREITRPGLTIIRGILAAASVCLFIVFGIEQYRIVDKITLLEKQNTSIARNPEYHRTMQLSVVKKLIEYNLEHVWILNGKTEGRNSESNDLTGTGNFFKARFLLLQLKELARNQYEKLEVSSAMIPLPDTKKTE